MELLYYKDEVATSAEGDENTNIHNLLDDNVSKLIAVSQNHKSTNSQAVYRISPVVIYKNSHKENFVYPKVKVEGDQDLEGKSKINPHEDSHVIKNRFEAKDSVFGKVPEAKEQSSSNFLEVVDPEYNESSNKEFDCEIKKQQDEDEGRKHLDKFNLLRGFQFAFDPFNNRSNLNYEEDYTESNLEFESVDVRLENIFGITKD